MHAEDLAVAFNCAGARLYGVLSMPERPGPRGVLIVVGGPQYRAGSHRQFTLLARALAAQGIPAMRFDYRGMGDSEGERRSFEDAGDDLGAALDQFFEAVPELREVALWGLCDGASAALLYAGGDRRVTGLALLNPWARTETGAAKATLKHYYKGRLLDAGLWKKLATGRFDFGGAAVSFAGLLRSAAARPEAGGADSLPDRLYDGLQRFDGKVLLMLSSADLTAQEFAGLASASRGWQQLLAAPRVTQRRLEGADHTCSRRAWHDQVVNLTAAWMGSW